MSSRHRKHHTPLPAARFEPPPVSTTRPGGTAMAPDKPAADGPSATLPPDINRTVQGAPPEEVIRERAYYKWVSAGCPTGDGKEFWLDAEAELVRGSG